MQGARVIGIQTSSPVPSDEESSLLGVSSRQMSAPPATPQKFGALLGGRSVLILVGICGGLGLVGALLLCIMASRVSAQIETLNSVLGELRASPGLRPPIVRDAHMLARAPAHVPPSCVSDIFSDADPRFRAVRLSTQPPLWMALLPGDIAQSGHEFQSRVFAERALENSIRWVLAAEPQPVTILDVGANIGGASLIAASLGAGVVAFEPVAAHRHKIAASVCLNDFVVKPRVIAAGVSDKATTLRIQNFDEATRLIEGTYEECVRLNRHSHLLHDGHAENPEGNCAQSIDTVTLDRSLSDAERSSAVFAKLDIEGFEMHALLGASHLLASPRFRFLHFEYAPGLMRKAGTHTPGHIFAFLKTKGFACAFDTKWQDLVQGRVDPLDVAPAIESKDNFFCARGVPR